MPVTIKASKDPSSLLTVKVYDTLDQYLNKSMDARPIGYLKLTVSYKL